MFWKRVLRSSFLQNFIKNNLCKASRPRPKSFEIETRPETFETETPKKRVSRHISRPRPSLETPSVLYQAVQLQTSDCSIFTEKEGLDQIKVAMTKYDFGPDYKLN